jgi:hypothetical protein
LTFQSVPTQSDSNLNHSMPTDTLCDTPTTQPTLQSTLASQTAQSMPVSQPSEDSAPDRTLSDSDYKVLHAAYAVNELLSRAYRTEKSWKDVIQLLVSSQA